MKKLLAAGLAAAALLLPAAQARDLAPYKGGDTPPLSLPDLSGKTHTLQDYRGQVVLVNFWATWCPPCRAEMPSMQRLKNRMAGKPFTILAVDMGDKPEDVHAFLKEMKLDFTILMDSDGKVLRDWKVFAFPTTFLIDKAGRIRYALPGTKEWDDADAVARVEELLAAKSP